MIILLIESVSFGQCLNYYSCHDSLAEKSGFRILPRIFGDKGHFDVCGVTLSPVTAD
jgi:hypothetical protein